MADIDDFLQANRHRSSADAEKWPIINGQQR
jgi:hypothetical protein